MRMHPFRAFKNALQLLVLGLLLLMLVVDVPLPDVKSSNDEAMRRALRRLQVALAPTDIQSEESFANESMPLRLARTRRVCDGSRDLQIRKGPVAEYLMVDIAFETATCVPAKVSSTDWKYLLIKLHMYRYPRPPRGQKLHRSATLVEANITYLQEHQRTEQDRMLESFYKYVVVRHPWLRLVAGYQELFESHGPELQAQDALVKFVKTRFDPLNETGTPQVLFHEYVQYVLSLSMSPIDMDRKWMPMRYICEPCAIQYDYIVKLENLDLDMMELFYNINITGHKMPYFGSIVKQDPPVSHIMPYFDGVSESDYLQLVRLYKSDFDLFGYRVPARKPRTPSSEKSQK